MWTWVHWPWTVASSSVDVAALTKMLWRAWLFLRGKEILSKWSAIEIKSRHDLKRSVCNMFLVNGYYSHLINRRESWSKSGVRAFTIAHDDRDCCFGRNENAPSQSKTHSHTQFLCPTATQTIKTNKIVVYAMHNT